MGNLVTLNSSAAVLERRANKVHSPIASPWLRIRDVCTSASHYVEVILVFAYFILEMAERQKQNALFMTARLQLDLWQPVSSYDLSQQCLVCLIKQEFWGVKVSVSIVSNMEAD